MASLRGGGGGLSHHGRCEGAKPGGWLRLQPPALSRGRYSSLEGTGRAFNPGRVSGPRPSSAELLGRRRSCERIAEALVRWARAA
jgi:hypothetical protein